MDALNRREGTQDHKGCTIEIEEITNNPEQTGHQIPTLHAKPLLRKGIRHSGFQNCSLPSNQRQFNHRKLKNASKTFTPPILHHSFSNQRDRTFTEHTAGATTGKTQTSTQ